MKRIVLAAAFALGLGPSAGVAAGASRDAVACLDSSSPSYAADAAIVRAAATGGDALTPFVFDGGQGVSERFFRYLSRTKCGIIMGYPVDLTEPDPPDGLALTSPYLETAYVLATRTKLTQSQLRPGMTIAVGMATAPHFYLAGAFGSVPSYTADTFQTQEQVLDSLLAHHADAAMVWLPSLVRYRASHAPARALYLSPLKIQHAAWRVAALYDEKDPQAKARFERALERLRQTGQLARIVAPYAVENSIR